MYFRLVYHYPKEGKNAELRTLIEEHVKAENASGSSRNAFVITMLKPTIAMVHAIQHDDFAAWERHLSNRSTSFQSYAAQMQSLIAGNPVQELHEVVSRETSSQPVNYIWQTAHTPQPGAAMPLRRLLEERLVTSIQRGSASATLMSQAFATTFTLTIGFSDLAGVEAYLKAMPADPAMPTWGAARNNVTTGPASQLLARVVVPFPAD